MMDLHKELSKPVNQIGVLLGTLAIFLVLNAALGPNDFVALLLGVLIAAEILFFVGLEVREGASKHGWKHEVLDTLLAFGVAIALWFGASFLLSTSAPLSAVASCSMLPDLQRGDFVVVQGAEVQAYDIQMTREELDSLISRAEIHFQDKVAILNGSIIPYCSISTEELCRAFRQSPEKFVEKKGALEYRYASCSKETVNGTVSEPCLVSVSYDGKQYPANFSHDIIVYGLKPSDFYYYAIRGDIVHRAMFRIDVDGEYYYLTRGDNNPILDVQAFDYGLGLTNSPVPEKNVRGKVIARVPFLGYFKLFLFGHLKEDQQCRTQLEFPHG